MGQIRDTHLKNICKDIYKSYMDRVSTDFESNKKLVEEITDIGDRKYLRNRIAGYLIVLKNKEGRLIIPPKKEKKIRSGRERREQKQQFKKWIG